MWFAYADKLASWTSPVGCFNNAKEEACLATCILASNFEYVELELGFASLGRVCTGERFHSAAAVDGYICETLVRLLGAWLRQLQWKWLRSFNANWVWKLKKHVSLIASALHGNTEKKMKGSDQKLNGSMTLWIEFLLWQFWVESWLKLSSQVIERRLITMLYTSMY